MAEPASNEPRANAWERLQEKYAPGPQNFMERSQQYLRRNYPTAQSIVNALVGASAGIRPTMGSPGPPLQNNSRYFGGHDLFRLPERSYTSGLPPSRNMLTYAVDEFANNPGARGSSDFGSSGIHMRDVNTTDPDFIAYEHEPFIQRLDRQELSRGNPGPMVPANQSTEGLYNLNMLHQQAQRLPPNQRPAYMSTIRRILGYND